MKLSDIKPGMVVQLRNGNYCIVLKTKVDGIIMASLIEEYSWSTMKQYNKDTLKHLICENLDIVKVGVFKYSTGILNFSPSQVTWIWEELSIPELTIDEITEKFNIQADKFGSVKETITVTDELSSRITKLENKYKSGYLKSKFG